MNTNLDKIALDLYGKIQTRYPNDKIGDVPPIDKLPVIETAPPKELLPLLTYKENLLIAADVDPSIYTVYDAPVVEPVVAGVLK